jgi:hypothetical protein
MVARPSPRSADQLVETGTQAELVARGGLYARLYEIQFKPQLTGMRPVIAGDGLAQALVDP